MRVFVSFFVFLITTGVVNALNYRFVDITNYFMGVWVLTRSQYSTLIEDSKIPIDKYWSDDKWFFAGEEFSFDPDEYYEKAYNNEFPFGYDYEYVQFNQDFCDALRDDTIDVIWFSNGYTAGETDNPKQMSYSLLNLHRCFEKYPEALEKRKTFVGYSAIDYMLAEIYYFNYGYVVHGNLLKNLYDRGDKTWEKTHDAIEATRKSESYKTVYSIEPYSTASKEERSYFGQVVSMMFNCASVLHYMRGLLDFDSTISFLEIVDDPETLPGLIKLADDLESGQVKPLVILVGCVEHFMDDIPEFEEIWDRLTELFEEKNIPVFTGVKFGHIDSACSEENFPIIFSRNANLHYDGVSGFVELEVFLKEEEVFSDEDPEFVIPEKYLQMAAEVDV